MSFIMRALCAVRENKVKIVIKRSSSDKNRALQRCASTASSGSGSSGGGSQTGHWSAEVPEQIGEGDGPFGLEACKALLTRLEDLDSRTSAFDPRKEAARTPTPSSQDMYLVCLLYNHMLHTYDLPRYCDVDNHGQRGTGSTLPPAGCRVPNYFANVRDQSIHRRKVLSLAGLRNLVVFGSEIFDELRKHLFASDPAAYSSNEGVHKMRHYTGNAVDLDTTVLRANDKASLDAVNLMNTKAGGRTYSCSKEFGNSDQAAVIAHVAAEILLNRFARDFKLSKGAAKKRKVDPNDIPSTIPTARSNSDRGKFPLWRYANAGQDSFHANVPHVDDVVGALLRAPLRAAKIYLTIFLENSGEALQAHLDRFFTDCIADACFNQKWKAIEEFGQQMAREKTIVYTLQSMQQRHQSEFLEVMDLDDDDYTQEKKLMWQHVRGRCAVAVCPSLTPRTHSHPHPHPHPGMPCAKRTRKCALSRRKTSTRGLKTLLLCFEVQHMHCTS